METSLPTPMTARVELLIYQRVNSTSRETYFPVNMGSLGHVETRMTCGQRKPKNIFLIIWEGRTLDHCHIHIHAITGWWFGTWLLFSILNGMSSSQLMNSIIFSRWLLHHQPDKVCSNMLFFASTNPGFPSHHTIVGTASQSHTS